MNEAVGELFELSATDAAEYEVRVAEESATGDLIGVSIFHKRPLGDSEAFEQAVCVAVLALSREYRGWRMPDGTRIGTFLLCHTLAQVEHVWDAPMPVVWGVVHQDNRPCQRLLSSHHFWRLRGNNRDPSDPYFVHMRDDGVDWRDGFGAQTAEIVAAITDD